MGGVFVQRVIKGEGLTSVHDQAFSATMICRNINSQEGEKEQKSTVEGDDSGQG